MKTIIENLHKIYFVSKMLHWNAIKYDQHLLYDRIAEGMIDAIDKVAESCIFPFETITDLDLNITNYSLDELIRIIEETARDIQVACLDPNTTEGAKNTLSGIAEQLNIKAYLINRNLR